MQEGQKAKTRSTHGTGVKVRTVQAFSKVHRAGPVRYKFFSKFYSFFFERFFNVSGMLAMFVFHCPTFIRVSSRRETQLLKQ